MCVYKHIGVFEKFNKVEQHVKYCTDIYLYTLWAGEGQVGRRVDDLFMVIFPELFFMLLPCANLKENVHILFILLLFLFLSPISLSFFLSFSLCPSSLFFPPSLSLSLSLFLPTTLSVSISPPPLTFCPSFPPLPLSLSSFPFLSHSLPLFLPLSLFPPLSLFLPSLSPLSLSPHLYPPSLSLFLLS